MFGDGDTPGSYPFGTLGPFAASCGVTVTLQYHHDAETPESLPHDSSWSSSTITYLQRLRSPRDLAHGPQHTDLPATAQAQLERNNRDGKCLLAESLSKHLNKLMKKVHL